MFDADDVRGCLTKETDALLSSLETLECVASTNSLLMNAEPPAPGYWKVAIANEQTAGRGRGDNAWQSLPGAGLWMSIAHTFASPPADISSLTLALGVTLANEIESLCGAGIALKWPNDLILKDRKLGGMLVELSASRQTVVCGIGINFHAPSTSAVMANNALPAAGLGDEVAEAPSRAELAARIIERAADALPRFASEGLAPWLEDWPRYDWLFGHEIVVIQGSEKRIGIARGIDSDGALLLDDGLQQSRIISGSVRRMVPSDSA